MYKSKASLSWVTVITLRVSATKPIFDRFRSDRFNMVFEKMVVDFEKAETDYEFYLISTVPKIWILEDNSMTNKWIYVIHWI